MAYSLPPTDTEVYAARDAVVTSMNALAQGVGGNQLCTLLAAAIQVMVDQAKELIAAYNANCGTYTGVGADCLEDQIPEDPM
jgi:hypothetical protein